MTPVFVITLQDIVGLILFGIIACVALYMYIPIAFKQLLCKHDGGVSETQACDAICRKCRKNLGFIGSWHKKENK